MEQSAMIRMKDRERTEEQEEEEEAELEEQEEEELEEESERGERRGEERIDSQTPGISRSQSLAPRLAKRRRQISLIVKPDKKIKAQQNDLTAAIF